MPLFAGFVLALLAVLGIRHYSAGQDLARSARNRRLAILEVNLLATKLLERDRPELQARFKVTDYQVRAFFEQHPDLFRSRDTFTARHILVSPRSTQEDADARLARIQTELAAGKAFGDVARAESDDLGTRAMGGLLKDAPFGTFPPEFDQAVRTQPLGQVGAPVKTPDGMHLLLVEKITPGVQKTFAQAGAAASSLATADHHDQVMKVYMAAAKSEVAFLEGPAAEQAALQKHLVPSAESGQGKVVALAGSQMVLEGDLDLFLELSLDEHQRAQLQATPGARELYRKRLLEFEILAAKARIEGVK